MEAHAIGLGSCWVQIRNRMHNNEEMAEDYVKNLINIPTSCRVLSIIGIGYPAQTRKGKPAIDLQWEKIHHNSYNKRK